MSAERRKRGLRIGPGALQLAKSSASEAAVGHRRRADLQIL